MFDVPLHDVRRILSNGNCARRPHMNPPDKQRAAHQRAKNAASKPPKRSHLYRVLFFAHYEWPHNRARFSMRRLNTKGVAYVEFLMVFIPIFLLFMGIAQLGLLFSARLLVHHAANRAVRSAAVVLDDHPRYYNDEPRGFTSGPALVAGQVSTVLSRLGFQIASANQPIMSRRATIEAAAALPLIGLAPMRLGTLGGSLGSKGLAHSIQYTLESLSVDIPSFPKTTVLGSVMPEPVSVRVRYRYACGVPLAGKLVCPSGSKVLEAQAALLAHGAPYVYP